MIHQYKLNGYNIVLDVYSGSVHIVDDVAYDIIAMYESAGADATVAAMLEKYGDRPDVTEAELYDCIEDIEALKKAGKLYSTDLYEGIDVGRLRRKTR